MSKRSLAIVDKSYLRPAQQSLYHLIVKKIDSQEKITLDEAELIWRTKVHRNMVNGEPYRVDYFANRYVDKHGNVSWTQADVKMTRPEIVERVLMWLTSNIGLLVIRGYLQVIPMIEIKTLEAEK